MGDRFVETNEITFSNDFSGIQSVSTHLILDLVHNETPFLFLQVHVSGSIKCDLSVYVKCQWRFHLLKWNIILRFNDFRRWLTDFTLIILVLDNFLFFGDYMIKYNDLSADYQLIIKLLNAY